MSPKIATGVYWKPVFNLLEGSFELLVATAQHSKAVPGRKTDIKDAEWIAERYATWEARKPVSFPSFPQRELRDLTWLTRPVDGGKGQRGQSCAKTPWRDTKLKLGDVVSDIMGKASRLILQAITDGETDPSRLAALAVGRVRATQEQLEAALQGQITEHHRFLLQEHLSHIHHLEEAIDRVTAEIIRRFTPLSPPEDGSASQKEREAPPETVPDSPFHQEVPCAPQAALSWSEAVVLLCSIPGIGERAAIGILAEIGTNMRASPDGRPFVLVGRDLSRQS